jgi:hypothetical protein
MTKEYSITTQRGPAMTENKYCHSECSEESSPSNPLLEDPSQNRLRMTKEYSNTMQRGLAITDMRAGLAGSRYGRKRKMKKPDCRASLAMTEKRLSF